MDGYVIHDYISICHAPEHQEDSLVPDFLVRANIFHFQDSKNAFLDLLCKAGRDVYYIPSPQ